MGKSPESNFPNNFMLFAYFVYIAYLTKFSFNACLDNRVLSFQNWMIKSRLFLATLREFFFAVNSLRTASDFLIELSMIHFCRFETWKWELPPVTCTSCRFSPTELNMRKNKRRDLQHTWLHCETNENLAFIA